MIYPNKKLKQLSGKSGKVETQLKGHERIFSRNDTSKIITMAQRSLNREHLVKLGRFIVDAIDKQEKQKPQFTS